MKDKMIKFIDSQIKELTYKIKETKVDYECEPDISESIKFYGELQRLKGSKSALETMRKIFENEVE